MLKRIIVAAALAVSALSLPQAAEAKTKVFIGVGGPAYGGYYCNDPWRCGYGPRGHRHDRWDPWDRGGYGWGPEYTQPYGFYYGEDYAYPRYHSRRIYRNVVSCSEARWMLADRGWRNVRANDCHGSSYSFTARRKGAVSVIRVSARSGNIISVRRIR